MKWIDIKRRTKETQGQSLLEFAFSLPIIFLLIVNLVNFGAFFYAWITVANAARAGANYAILGGASVGGVGTPGGTAIANVVNADTASLPSAVTVLVCQVNGSASPATATKLTGSGSCSTSTLDPEYSNYVLTYVDVGYTYKPIISAFSFPKLGVYLTLPPLSIHQVAYMRSIN